MVWYTNADSQLVKKVKWIAEEYKEYFSVRGDGNCFFRAFVFAWLRELGDEQHFDGVLAWIEASAELLVTANFDRLAYEDFQEEFVEMVKHVKANPSDLLEQVNQEERSNSVIVYLRFVTSATMLLNADDYAPFVEAVQEGMTLDRYRQTQVEAFGTEGDHLMIQALSRAANVSMNILYLDRSAGDEPTVHHVDPAPTAGSSLTISLLYRPGHYDVLRR